MEVSLRLPVKFVLRKIRHEVAADTVLAGKYRENPGSERSPSVRDQQMKSMEET